MIDNRAALPTGIVGVDSFANLCQLSARVVKEFVEDRRVRAELLLRHATACVVDDVAGVSFLRPAEIAVETLQATRIVIRIRHLPTRWISHRSYMSGQIVVVIVHRVALGGVDRKSVV